MDFRKIFRLQKPHKRRRIAARGFDAAKKGNLLAGWATSGASIDTSIREGLPALRARSRDQYLNNDFVRRYVEMVRSNIVGPNGVVMQSNATDPGGTADTLAAENIEAGFRIWCRPENCDFRMLSGWVEKQKQAVGSAAIDGEILARKYTGKGYGVHGFMVQHLDPALLDVEHNKPLKNGSIRLGIEYDNRDRAVAYHLLSGRGYDYDSQFMGRHYSRVPVGEIIHTFEPGQVGQSRGYPWLSTGLGSVKMLDAYFEAALTAARAGAAKMGFIETEDGASYDGDEIDDDGSVISDFESGIIEQLPYGTHFKEFDPRYPHEQFDTFTKTFLRRLAASGGVSYSGLTGDLEGVNYSSIRAGVLEEREMWKSRQAWFIEGYVRPIFEGWLDAALLGGHIKVLGKPLKAWNFEKYRNVTWQARRWAWVDPKKDTDSNILQINNNLTTASAVIREQGRDPEEVFQEAAKDKDRLKKLGLTESEVVNCG